MCPDSVYERAASVFACNGCCLQYKKNISVLDLDATILRGVMSFLPTDGVLPPGPGDLDAL